MDAIVNSTIDASCTQNFKQSGFYYEGADFCHQYSAVDCRVDCRVI